MYWMGRMDQSNTEGFIGGLVFDLYTVETGFDIHIIVMEVYSIVLLHSRLMPLCINCTQAVPYLYTVYHLVNNARLEQCVRLCISNSV
jgi:hypothetical protein